MLSVSSFYRIHFFFSIIFYYEILISLYLEVLSAEMQKSLDYARIMRFLLRLIDNPVFLRIMIRFNSEVCKDNTKIPGSLSRLATRKDPIYNKNVNSKMHKQNF